MSAPSLSSAKYLLTETDPGKLGLSASEVAFVGRSNVGKSTLLNALCGKDLARVSSTPGRTRTINVYAASEGRWLVDLPGYGFAQGDRAEAANWGPMIEGYLTRRSGLRMVFALVDAKIGPTPLDAQMLKWLQFKRLPWRVVATKADQVRPTLAHGRRRELSQASGVLPEDVFWVSAKEDRGLRELRAEVLRLLA
jgi:GTP-binding protein